MLLFPPDHTSFYMWSFFFLRGPVFFLPDNGVTVSLSVGSSAKDALASVDSHRKCQSALGWGVGWGPQGAPGYGGLVGGLVGGWLWLS